MALKIVTGGTTGAADGTAVSQGGAFTNPLVIVALNTAVNAHIRCDDGYWSADQSFDVPTGLEVSFDGGSTWYDNADEPITAPEIEDVNYPIKIRQTVAAASASGSFTTDGTYTAITALSTPTLTVTPGDTQNALSWTNVANEDASPGYTVEWSANGSTGWTALTTTAQNVTTYTDTGLTNGVARYYRVKAEGSGRYGDSGYGTGNGTPVAPTYSDLVLATSGLQSYWKLDETSGTSMADSKGSVTGTAGAGVTVNGTSLLSSGAGKAATFADADNSNVNLGNVYKFTGTAAFTVECLIRPTVTNQGHIFGNFNFNPNVQGYRLAINGSGKLFASRYDSAGNSDNITGGTTLANNTIYHIAVTYDGSDMRLYINGVSDASPVASSRSMAAGTDTHIGDINNVSPGFAGRIDEVAVYNVALSGSDIAAHYAKA